MRKLVYSALASITIVSAAPMGAKAFIGPPPVPVTPTGASAGAGGSAGAAAGGIIGIAGFLVAYDLIRRTTCSGDFLGLGGPGFNEPIRPDQNVLPPLKCAPAKKVLRKKKSRIKSKIISVLY